MKKEDLNEKARDPMGNLDQHQNPAQEEELPRSDLLPPEPNRMATLPGQPRQRHGDEWEIRQGRDFSAHNRELRDTIDETGNLG